MSKLRKHFEERQAKTAAEVSAERPAAVNSTYELQLGQLAQHKRQLKEIQSTEAKVAAKKELLPEYDSYLDGILSAGTGAQDNVLVLLMLWHLDCGSFDRAIELGEYAINHSLAMPDGHSRSVPAVLAEEIADHYLKTQVPTLNQLREVLELVSGCDMHDQIMAKLHKAIGTAMVEVDEMNGANNYVHDAIAHLERAYQLDNRSGVKNWLNNLRKKIGQ